MAPRFSLNKRNGKFYAQLYSQQLHRYLTARCTGATDRNGALLIVAGWLRDGWPTGRQARPRPVEVAIELGGILAQLRSMELSADDAGRILDVLRTRDLIAGGAPKGGPGAELLTDYVTRFWSYDESPYIREKLAHGQQIGRRHAYDAGKLVRQHWLPAFEGRQLSEIGRQKITDLGKSA